MLGPTCAQFAQLFLSRSIEVGQQRRYQHVGALPDLIVYNLVFEHGTDACKSLLPGQNMHVVAVNQRAVDIEKYSHGFHI